MPSTKIINVSRDDSFEDIFDLFKQAVADEVILIFPRGSKFAKTGTNFEAIKGEADKSNKEISIMTGDPIVADLAMTYGIVLLGSAPSRRREPASASMGEPDNKAGAKAADDNNDWQSITGPDEEPEPPEPEVTLSEDDEIEADLAMAASRRGRSMRDVVGGKRSKRDLKVKRGDDYFELDVKSEGRDREDEREDKEEAEDIVKVWQRRSGQRIYRRPARLTGGLSSIITAHARKTIFVIILGLVLVIGAVLYSTLASAKIIIHPQRQELNFQLKVTASTQVASVNSDFNRIPGQLFSAQKEESETFPASGEKNVAQKASGKITIFNKSSSSQRLVATTRFETPEGLIFRIPQTVTIPAATGGSAAPGSIESVVYADRPGEAYNIGPTKFTIPGFKGSPKFEEFYAASTEPMTGGIVGLSPVVTESDFSKALETLTKKVRGEVLTSLKKQSGQFKILDSTKIDIKEPVTNVKVGEAAKNLEMTLIGSARTLAFRESDVLELVRSYVAKNDDLEVVEKSLTFNYSDASLDSAAKNMNFIVQVSGRAVAKVGPSKVIQDVAGMNEDSIRSYFKSLKEVESARVILSPFWVKHIPRDHDKVKVEIVVD